MIDISEGANKMEELELLKERIVQRFIELGLKETTKFKNNWQRYFEFGGESWFECPNGYPVKQGFDIYFEECYRSNGTSQNRSCYIYAIERHGVSNRAFYKVKVSTRDSVKKQIKLIDELVEAYKLRIGRQ